jgi:hypothetical protein
MSVPRSWTKHLAGRRCRIAIASRRTITATSSAHSGNGILKKSEPLPSARLIRVPSGTIETFSYFRPYPKRNKSGIAAGSRGRRWMTTIFLIPISIRRKDKRLEIVKRQVPDPFSKIGACIEVDANLIGDQLGRMLRYRQLTRLQYDAGRRIEELFDATESGDLRSVDMTRDIIDCVQPGHEWSSASRVDALRTLRKLFETQFSHYHAKILWWAIRDGVPIKTIAAHFGFKDHKPILAELKEALDDFARIGKPDKWQRFAA